MEKGNVNVLVDLFVTFTKRKTDALFKKNN